MGNHELFSNGALEHIRELVARSAQKSAELAKQAAEADRVDEMWQELYSYLERGWPLHVLELMRRADPLLKKMRAESSPALPSLEEVYRTARDQVDQIRRRFPERLEAACKSNNLPLDLESRHPRYTFEQGFFILEVDDRKGLAKLSDYEGQLAEFPADIGAVVEKVIREHERVFGRPFDGAHFLEKLFRNYRAVLKKRNEPDESAMPIRAITTRLGKNEKGFRTDEFLIDLSRLVRGGPTQIQGYRFDLQQTRDTRQGMLLHGPAGRSYVGFITFRKAGDKA